MEKQKQTRKPYAPNGTRSQRRQTLLIDEQNFDWLLIEPNRSRYINELIRKDRYENATGKLRFSVMDKSDATLPRRVALVSNLKDAIMLADAKAEDMRKLFNTDDLPKGEKPKGNIHALEIYDEEQTTEDKDGYVVWGTPLYITTYLLRTD